ncbi:BamA/TamA family outer membrane protein [Natroniella sulfidigena]|uniref:BamA/OMP85 family outer membrane protein n=1 Tax=Natroniella sulfidigena TaxID=723921 RepID=UPI00200AC91A|nr:BamA/TamA family outer membrane protein [Natroniella sulfidigena]MCK8816376.1 BamA/TamA family outer membrane protein [Natroniella sulfidigena]
MFKKTGLTLLILVVLLASNSLIAAAEEPVPTDNTVTGIEVTGNKLVSEEEVLEEVTTEIGDEVSNEKLQQDMQQVFDLGYFFDLQILFRNYEDGVKLVIEVIENPELSAIKIEGNQEISTEKLKELLKLQEGEILNVNSLDQGVERINQYYQEQGYVLAQVVDVTIKEQDQLEITIDEGRLNSVSITGNEETEDFVIERELTLEEGEVFNIDQMWNDFRNLYNLGYFKDIRPDMQPVPTDPQAVDLVVEVEEQKTGTFSVGGGYSSAAGWTGMVDVEKDNLFGRGQKVNLSWEFGDTTTYELGFYEPWAFGSETSLNFNLYRTEHDDPVDDVSRRQGGDITVGHPLADDITGYLQLDYHNTKYEDEDGEEYDDNTRSVTLKTIRDTRDNIFSPRSGSRQELSVENAGLLGGDTDFTKYEADLRNYLPAREKDTWAFRLKTGLSDGELPQGERYSLTGLNEIRGYSSDYYDRDNNAVENGFVDGNSMLVSNLEYRFGIVDNVTGVAFADAGKTFANNSDISLNDLNYSVGLGARFNTPMGQLGLDYGYAPEGELDDKTNLSIRIGNTF